MWEAEPPAPGLRLAEVRRPLEPQAPRGPERSRGLARSLLGGRLGTHNLCPRRAPPAVLPWHHPGRAPPLRVVWDSGGCGPEDKMASRAPCIPGLLCPPPSARIHSEIQGAAVFQQWEQACGPPTGWWQGKAEPV